MSVCAMDDKALIDTAEMGDKETYAACSTQYEKMRAMMNEVGEGEKKISTEEKQKQLNPQALQKADS